MESIKLLSRITHLLSATTIFALVSSNYLFDFNQLVWDEPIYKTLHIFSGVFLISSGIANIFLIKQGKPFDKANLDHAIWLRFFELKFVIALLLTPLINPILFLISKEEADIESLRNKVQFYLLLFVLVYSSFIRSFRNDVCSNFEKDLIMEQV